MEKRVTWEERTPCSYDRRWINLHGMAAANGDTYAPLSVPQKQWQKIRKTTRDKYRTTFYPALAEHQKMKPKKQYP